jgi:hypothetical protein
VSLELMKRLEGEVLEALASLAGQASFAGYELKTIDPHLFLGLEVNPRGAAITELVALDWLSTMAFSHARRHSARADSPRFQDD